MRIFLRGAAAVTAIGIVGLLIGSVAPPARADAVIGTVTCGFKRLENPHFSKGSGYRYVIAKARIECNSEGVPPTGTFWVLGGLFGPGIPEVSIRDYPAVSGLRETMYIPPGAGLNTAEGNYTAVVWGLLLTDGVPPVGVAGASATADAKRPPGVWPWSR